MRAKKQLIEYHIIRTINNIAEMRKKKKKELR